jgi:CTP synthase
VNNALLPRLVERGLRVSGVYPDKGLVEIVELPGHPWFLGTQFHAEYRSRPTAPHPLYRAFVEAALRHAGSRAEVAVASEGGGRG